MRAPPLAPAYDSNRKKSRALGRIYFVEQTSGTALQQLFYHVTTRRTIITLNYFIRKEEMRRAGGETRRDRPQ